MPRKKNQLTPEQQSEQFRDTVRRMIDAGELSPTDADAAIERILTDQKKRRP